MIDFQTGPLKHEDKKNINSSVVELGQKNLQKTEDKHQIQSSNNVVGLENQLARVGKLNIPRRLTTISELFQSDRRLTVTGWILFPPELII